MLVIFFLSFTVSAPSDCLQKASMLSSPPCTAGDVKFAKVKKNIQNSIFFFFFFFFLFFQVTLSRPPQKKIGGGILPVISGSNCNDISKTPDSSCVYSCNNGDDITVNLQAKLIATSNKRYDIGTYYLCCFILFCFANKFKFF